MKLKCLFVVGILFVAMVAQAQQLQEVVYLKNGSVIRGVIIEQVPNESLKIQTADGSIFAYQMDEVEKIAKEEFSVSRNHSHKSIPFKEYGIKRGYRGFVDLGYSINVGTWGKRRLEFSTSHGFQFNPFLFVGAGIGLHYFDWRDYLGMPFFGHFRVSFPFHPICQPFIDFRVGYTVLLNETNDGFYMAPAIGCRFAVSRLCGISVSVGYSMQSLKEELREKWKCGDSYYCESFSNAHKNSGGITLKVGVDF